MSTSKDQYPATVLYLVIHLFQGVLSLFCCFLIVSFDGNIFSAILDVNCRIPLILLSLHAHYYPF